jgi:precorrin-2 methylase
MGDEPIMSEKVMEVLDYLENREKAAEFANPMERVQAVLQGWTEDEVTQFIAGAIMGATLITGGDPMGFSTAMITIGLELGAEMERRGNV